MRAGVTFEVSMEGWSWERGLPKEVVQSAGTGCMLFVDCVVPAIPAHGVFSQPQELLLVPQHASILGITDVIRVSQPLHIVIILT